MYSHGVGMDMLDKASCRAFAAAHEGHAGGFQGVQDAASISRWRIPAAVIRIHARSGSVTHMVAPYSNVREALGDDIEIAVHCHNELDEPSADRRRQGCRADESAVHRRCAESAMSPKRGNGVSALRPHSPAHRRKAGIGARLQAFIDNQAVDIIHPDLAFAGGFTGVKKIANYAV